MHFRCGAIDFGSDASVNEKLKNVKMQISTKDKMFESIRFKHFATIFTFLSENAKQLQVQQAKAKVDGGGKLFFSFCLISALCLKNFRK